jgi:hypothetical protein
LEKIQTSAVSWEIEGMERRREWASSAKDSFRAIGLKAGYGTEADYDRIAEAWVAWGEKPEARFMFIDGAVLAWK